MGPFRTHGLRLIPEKWVTHPPVRKGRVSPLRRGATKGIMVALRGRGRNPAPKAFRVAARDRELVTRFIVDLPQMNPDMSDHRHGGVSGLERPGMQVDRQALGERVPRIRSANTDHEATMALVAD